VATSYTHWKACLIGYWRSPQLTHTKGRCPPEDVGGVPGYAYFLEVMADKKHPEYVELSEWYGEHFDPADSGEEELRKNANQFGLVSEKCRV